MSMPGRTYSAGSEYRYGFNGKETSSEISSGAVSFEARIYDARIGKFLSVDPLNFKYISFSAYMFAENCPTKLIDIDGYASGDPTNPAKVAFYGWVPSEQYYIPGPNGTNLGRTAYDASHIKYFSLQAFRLQKSNGFVAKKASTGQDILNGLISATAASGSISFMAYFGHAGPSGLFMRDDEGFYGNKRTNPNTGSVEELTKYISSGKIKFASNATIFLDGCNTLGDKNIYSTTPAYELVKQIPAGVNVIGATGSVAMSNTKNANGKFIVTGHCVGDNCEAPTADQNFYLLYKVEERKLVGEMTRTTTRNRKFKGIGGKQRTVKTTYTTTTQFYEITSTIYKVSLGKTLDIDTVTDVIKDKSKSTVLETPTKRLETKTITTN